MITSERVIKGRPALQPTAVGTTTVKVPLSRSGTLRRVFVKLVSGAGANFTVYIYDKESTPGDENVVFSYDSSSLANPKLLDLNTGLVFQNDDGANCLWVKLVPNAGADNNFFIQLLTTEEAE